MPFIVSVGDGRVTSPSGGPLDVLIQTRTPSSSVWGQRGGREAGEIHYLKTRPFFVFKKKKINNQNCN